MHEANTAPNSNRWTMHVTKTTGGCQPGALAPRRLGARSAVKGAATSVSASALLKTSRIDAPRRHAAVPCAMRISSSVSCHCGYFEYDMIEPPSMLWPLRVCSNKAPGSHDCRSPAQRNAAMAGSTHCSRVSRSQHQQRVTMVWRRSPSAMPALRVNRPWRCQRRTLRQLCPLYGHRRVSD